MLKVGGVYIKVVCCFEALLLCLYRSIIEMAALVAASVRWTGSTTVVGCGRIV